MEKEFESGLLETAVNEFAKLPGIGRKTALRLVLYLLRQNEDVALQFGEAIIKLRKEIRYCSECHNISEQEHCPICSNPLRDHSTICVVENVKDVMSIENTHQHNGAYHVLGGLISPMDGVGPRNRQPCHSCCLRLGKGGDSCPQCHYGGRHYKFLHLPTPCPLPRRENHDARPRCERGQ